MRRDLSQALRLVAFQTALWGSPECVWLPLLDAFVLQVDTRSSPSPSYLVTRPGKKGKNDENHRD
jgi:hypothetical protein